MTAMGGNQIPQHLLTTGFGNTFEPSALVFDGSLENRPHNCVAPRRSPEELQQVQGWQGLPVENELRDAESAPVEMGASQAVPLPNAVVLKGAPEEPVAINNDDLSGGKSPVSKFHGESPLSGDVA